MKLNKTILAIFAICIVVFSAMSFVSADEDVNVADDPSGEEVVLVDDEPGDDQSSDDQTNEDDQADEDETDGAEDDSADDAEDDSEDDAEEDVADDVGDNPYRHGAVMNPMEDMDDQSEDGLGDSAPQSAASNNALSNHAAGNPLVVLLAALAVLGLCPLRFRK